MLARKIVLTMLILVVACVGLIVGSRTQAMVSGEATGASYTIGDQAGDTQTVTSFDAGAGNGWIKMPADFNAGEQPGYKAGEIIVKFKKPVADAVEQQLGGKTPSKNLKLTKSLDNLNSKHKVKSIEPVFKDFKASYERMNNLLKKDAKSLNSDEKRILRRQQRAPKGVKTPELERIYIIKLEEGQSAEEAVADYGNDPSVEYVTLIKKITNFLTPNDSNYPQQWSLNNTGQDYPWAYYPKPVSTPGCDINTPEAWDIQTGSSDVVVAVVDSGVDYNHRDLQGNMWVDANGYYGYDFANDDNDPMDDYGHGTFCAGEIAAKTNNSIDITGVTWNSKIMAVKCLHSDGGGVSTDGMKAIEYAVDKGADIISLSWGAYEPMPDVEDAIEYAVSQGAIVVAAAGNAGDSNYGYPAAYDGVISVTATDSNDDRAVYFSNYGSWIDIAAPGLHILSLRASADRTSWRYGDTLRINSGTSMACPYVAGACALMLSVNTQLSSDDANTILRNTADALRDTTICASGRLDVFKAICGAVSSKGYINLDKPYYSWDANINILVSDLNLAGNNTCDVNITCVNDLEIVTLYAVGSGVGIFTGTIQTGSGDPEVNDGILQIANGQTITVTYYDADDGTGNSAEPNDTATADCVNPVISDVNYIEQVVGSWQVVAFQTNELATAKIVCGTTCDDSTIVVENLNPQLSHTFRFKGMEEGTYYFKIEVTDQAGNIATDSNDGNCFEFTRHDIYVPDDYGTIQEAIDASQDGDIIIVSENTYYESIDFKNKEILVSSTDPNDWDVVSATVIDGNGAAITVKAATGAQLINSSQLSGFTVTGGNYGVCLKYFNRLVVSNCIISGNNDHGVECNDAGIATIQNCIIEDNVNMGVYIGSGARATIANSSIYGSKIGVYLDYAIVHAYASITNSLIYDNDDGVVVSQWGDAAITNCTIVYNSNYGATRSFPYSTANIKNCIFWANGDDFNNCSATYSCIENGYAGTGNISADPCFINAGNDDFRIGIHSPCVNAGYPSGNYTNQTDIDGQARVIGRCVDIGADEVYFNAPEPNGHLWKLDETSGTTADDSVGSADGSFNGNDPCWVTGHIGGAADFNGVSDYFGINGLNPSTDYNNFDTFTVTGWFKTSQSTGMQTIAGQWSNYNPAPGINIYFGWQVLVENKKVVARFGNASPTLSDITGTSEVNDGNWHHFVLVYPTKDVNAVLYVDGQSQGTPAKGPFNGGPSTGRIGDGSYIFAGNPVMKGGPFCGMIDDVMIFNRELTADEVEQLYLAGQ